jgi:pimeloyl-ACP methyl ester carboxylesterase
MARQQLGVERLVLLAPMPSFDFALAEFQRVLGCSDEVRDAVGARVESIARVTRAQARLDRLLANSGTTLLIHDVKDRSIPIQHARSLATLDDVSYVETRGLGHKRLLDDPDVHRHVLDFIA